MTTEEIMRQYKESICPRCMHYVDKDYNECSITLDIRQEAKCINYKCKDFHKKEIVKKDKFAKEKEEKLRVIAKKHNSIMFEHYKV